MIYIAPEKLEDFLRQLLATLEKNPDKAPLVGIFVHEERRDDCTVVSWLTGPRELHEHLLTGIAEDVEERLAEMLPTTAESVVEA